MSSKGKARASTTAMATTSSSSSSYPADNQKKPPSSTTARSRRVNHDDADDDADGGGGGGGVSSEELVTLISEDGQRFRVSLDVANISPVIRTMLADGDDGMGGMGGGAGDPNGMGDGGGGGGGGGFAESETRTVNLLQIRGEVLEVVVQYLRWHHRYRDAKGDADIPRFDSKIPPTLALELLMAADFLDV